MFPCINLTSLTVKPLQGYYGRFRAITYIHRPVRCPIGAPIQRLTLTCQPHLSGGLHHFNGPLSIITASVTLAKTQPRLSTQGVEAEACFTGHNSS